MGQVSNKTNSRGRGKGLRGGFYQGSNANQLLNQLNVSLPNGLVARGMATNKKKAKHEAARGMLDILDGNAQHVSSEVSQSISEGLRALRGEQGPGLSSPAKTFRPAAVILSTEEQERVLRARQEQQELIRQQIQYGPLPVKLWFAGGDDESGRDATETIPNRAPVEPEEEKILTSEDFIKELILKNLFSAIDKKFAQKDCTSSDERTSPDLVCKMCNLVFREKKYCEGHKRSTDHLHVLRGFFPGEGGYHCFLCWLSFQQAEDLINHVKRENHSKRARRKGVSRVWMMPEIGKTLVDLHKEVKRQRRRDRERSRSRDRRRHDEHDDRGTSSNSRKGLGARSRKEEEFRWKEEKGCMLRLQDSKDGRRKEGRESDRHRNREEKQSRDDKKDKSRDSGLKYSDLRTESIYEAAKKSWKYVTKKEDKEKPGVSQEKKKQESSDNNDSLEKRRHSDESNDVHKSRQKEEKSRSSKSQTSRTRVADSASQSRRHSHHSDHNQDTAEEQWDKSLSAETGSSESKRSPRKRRHSDVCNNVPQSRWKKEESYSNFSTSRIRDGESSCPSGGHSGYLGQDKSFPDSRNLDSSSTVTSRTVKIKEEPGLEDISIMDNPFDFRKITYTSNSREEMSSTSQITEKKGRISHHSNRISKKRRRSPSTSESSSEQEEVNEIEDDFEIDSIGRIENSEETLLKMKSAIIGILDEEISTLSKRVRK